MTVVNFSGVQSCPPSSQEHSHEFRLSDSERIRSVIEADQETLRSIDRILTGENKKLPTDTHCGLLTVTEAAHKLKISRPTVYSLIRKKILNPIDVGLSSRRIREQEILDLANGLIPDNGQKATGSDHSSEVSQ